MLSLVYSRQPRPAVFPIFIWYLLYAFDKMKENIYSHKDSSTHSSETFLMVSLQARTPIC